MTDEDKLKAYVERNMSRAKKSISSSSPLPKPITTIRPRSPLGYYRRKLIGDVVAYTFVIIMVCFIILLYLNTETLLSESNSRNWALVIGTSLMVLVISINIGKWFRYVSWINGEYYALNGWKNFFDLRSASFWKRRMYTNVRVNFILKSSAANLHREAILIFTKRIEKKWNKHYTKIDWEPGSGTPKDFVANGMSLHGDVSKVELVKLVKMLTTDFIPLAKLLNVQLEEVHIESDSTETERKTKKVSRNAYDRQSAAGH